MWRPPPQQLQPQQPQQQPQPQQQQGFQFPRPPFPGTSPAAPNPASPNQFPYRPPSFFPPGAPQTMQQQAGPNQQQPWMRPNGPTPFPNFNPQMNNAANQFPRPFLPPNNGAPTAINNNINSMNNPAAANIYSPQQAVMNNQTAPFNEEKKLSKSVDFSCDHHHHHHHHHPAHTPDTHSSPSRDPNATATLSASPSSLRNSPAVSDHSAENEDENEMMDNQAEEAYEDAGVGIVFAVGGLKHQSEHCESNSNTEEHWHPLGHIRVLTLLRRSPAARCGKIRINDILLAVNGSPIAPADFHRLPPLCRGVAGGTIVFELERGGRKFEVELVREKSSDGGWGESDFGNSNNNNNNNNNSFAEERDALLDERDELRAHIQELKDQVAAFEAQVANLEEEMRSSKIQVENEREEKGKEIETLKEEREKDIESLREEKGKEIEMLKEEKQKEIEALRAEKGREIETLKEEKENEIETLKEEKEKEIEALKNEKDKEIETLKEEKEKGIASLKEEIKILREEKEKEIEILKEEKQKEIEVSKEEKQKEIQTLKNEVEMLKSEKKKEIETIKGENESLRIKTEETLSKLELAVAELEEERQGRVVDSEKWKQQAEDKDYHLRESFGHSSSQLVKDAAHLLEIVLPPIVAQLDSLKEARLKDLEDINSMRRRMEFLGTQNASLEVEARLARKDAEEERTLRSRLEDDMRRWRKTQEIENDEREQRERERERERAEEREKERQRDKERGERERARIEEIEKEWKLYKAREVELDKMREELHHLRTQNVSLQRAITEADAQLEKNRSALEEAIARIPEPPKPRTPSPPPKYPNPTWV